MYGDSCPEGADEGEECVVGKRVEEGGEGAAKGLLGEGAVGVPEACVRDGQLWLRESGRRRRGGL